METYICHKISFPKPLGRPWLDGFKACENRLEGHGVNEGDNAVELFIHLIALILYLDTDENADNDEHHQSS